MCEVSTYTPRSDSFASAAREDLDDLVAKLAESLALYAFDFVETLDRMFRARPLSPRIARRNAEWWPRGQRSREGR